MKDLKHSSLYMNVFYRYVKFDAWETNIKRDTVETHLTTTSLNRPPQLKTTFL